MIHFLKQALSCLRQHKFRLNNYNPYATSWLDSEEH
jgi:hypothetical protein